jgi:asparagine synthase (glutamine-hydrolysing)
MDEINVIEKTKKLLVSIIQQSVRNISYVAVPFSGGLDSSIVAYIIKNYTKTHISLYTIGYPNSYDYRESGSAAEFLGLKHFWVSLDNELVKNKLFEYQKFSKDTNKVSISYTLPFYILLEYIKEKTIITGHGADTLFGGFYKYLNAEDISEAIHEAYSSFQKHIKIYELQIAKKFSKRLLLPFANKELAEFVKKLPENFFIQNGERKYLLRKVASSLGLPHQIVEKPKKAIQYSSGIINELKRIWKTSRSP